MLTVAPSYDNICFKLFKLKNMEILTSHKLMAQPSTYDKFESCHMLTSEPSTYDNLLFLLLETNRKTCHMLTALIDRAIWWKSTECIVTKYICIIFQTAILFFCIVYVYVVGKLQ